MSGFVAIISEKNNADCNAMLARINHRGPEIFGVAQIDAGTIGQNYLPADINSVYEQQAIPFQVGRPAAQIIGYDGQIGNRTALCEQFNIAPGAFQDERLLLDLYSRFGRDMFAHLGDGIFSFLILDENKGVLAARDLLGIKTLFYAEKDRHIYLASELKALLPITDEVYEFPAGHYMDGSGNFTAFATLPQQAPTEIHRDPETCISNVRRIIEQSIAERIDFKYKTGSLLSGGIDSSVIAMLANRLYKKKFGDNARLPTFALGVGESEDVRSARLVAKHIDSEHHELIVNLEEVLEALDRTIYHLESFDPSLVRSAVSNYLISKYAHEHGIEVLLSGEGGDEVFCGYIYLKQCVLEYLFSGQIHSLKFLHNNASLRLDHMNQCNQIRVVAPLISGELLNFALAMAPELKQKPEGNDRIEKWIFRKTFEKDLPSEIAWRLKAEFSQGSGSAGLLPDYFEKTVDENEYSAGKKICKIIRSKEEYYYYKIFTNYFGSEYAVDTVGQWVSV